MRVQEFTILPIEEANLRQDLISLLQQHTRGVAASYDGTRLARFMRVEFTTLPGWDWTRSTAEAVRCCKQFARFTVSLILKNTRGGVASKSSARLAEKTLDACLASDAVLLGA
jgi:hypothetical protein